MVKMRIEHCRHAGSGADTEALPNDQNASLVLSQRKSGVSGTTGTSDLEASRLMPSSSDESKAQTSIGHGLSNALHLLQLDDYVIKPNEIEIMTKPDGSPDILGRGAYGEVSDSQRLGRQWQLRNILNTMRLLCEPTVT